MSFGDAMSSVKLPSLKKQLRLDRDHRVAAENPKAFRKNWPKKKAGGKRRLRRAQNRAIDAAAAADAVHDVASDVRNKKLAKLPRKHGVVSLREAVELKRARRLRVAGRKSKSKAGPADK